MIAGIIEKHAVLSPLELHEGANAFTITDSDLEHHLKCSTFFRLCEEVNVKENMQQEFGEILAEINHRQSNLDFSELLESIKASRLG